MNNQEAIETIKCAKAEVEWNYPLNYAIAFDVAIKALEKQIVKTNADKIRNMTNEELAELLDSPCCFPEKLCPKIDDDTVDCVNCLIEWLQKEVE